MHRPPKLETCLDLTHAFPPFMQQLPSVPFMGLPLARCSTEEFIRWLTSAARDRSAGRTVAYLNAAQVNLAFVSADFAARLRTMDVLYADGQGVVWAARWLGLPIPERVNAADFIDELLGLLARESVRLALLGGRPGEAEAFADRACARHPSLRIVFHHHGYFAETEEAGVLKALNQNDPDLVLLGIGAPRQETLAEAWSKRSPPRVWWCVGALFEYVAGRRRRAPRWMRRLGLEWLFRLALEPRRLARRYLLGNPLFVYRVLRRAAIPPSTPTD